MDVAEIIDKSIQGLDRCQRSEWNEIYSIHVDDPLDRLEAWTPEHRQAVRAQLSASLMDQDDSEHALEHVARWSKKMAVALSCVVARDAMVCLTKVDRRTLSCIETAERWVRGAATSDDCHRAAITASEVPPSYLSGSVFYTAAFRATDKQFFASEAVVFTANAAVDNSDVTYYVSHAARDAATAAAIDAVQKLLSVEAVSGTLADDASAIQSERLCRLMGESLLTGILADWIG